MYCIDTREGDLIRLLEGTDEKVEVRQLPIADLWIGTATNTQENPHGIQENGILIERKSIRDLEASILDGRYREQRGRLLAFCHETKAQPMYLLEGGLGSGTGRLQKKALLKFIHRLTLHYQIPVIQTANLQETAEVFLTLVEQWKEDPTALQRTTELVKVSDGIHVQKKTNATDPRQFALSCLAQCSGVSVKMAEALLVQFQSIKGITAASVKEIQEVKVGTRRVGPAVAQRLWDLLNFEGVPPL
jgi:ERCC4-type nuclease